MRDDSLDKLLRRLGLSEAFPPRHFAIVFLVLAALFIAYAAWAGYCN